MLFRFSHSRIGVILLTVCLVCVGIPGFSGIAWCMDWSDKDDRFELTSCYSEMYDSVYISFLTCEANDIAGRTEATTCLDINALSISGWKTSNDRPKTSVSILPDRTSTPFLQSAAPTSFALKSLPVVLASDPSLILENIRTKSLRSIVLLI